MPVRKVRSVGYCRSVSVSQDRADDRVQSLLERDFIYLLIVADLLRQSFEEQPLTMSICT